MTSKTDPTHQGVSRRRGTRQLVSRLKISEKQIRKLVMSLDSTRRVEKKIVNKDTVPVYDYSISPEELTAIYATISSIVNLNLVGTELNRMPPNWWWQSTIEIPYRQGAAREINEFNRLITKSLIDQRRSQIDQSALPSPARAFLQEINIDQYLASPKYLAELENVYTSNFNLIKGLGDDVTTDIYRVINDGINAKISRTEIAKQIHHRFGVSQARAKRIADTEINKAYNDAKLNAADVAAEETGLRAGVLHLSALIPTTRSTHAKRHGNAYTVAQQRQWWDEGVNRINCHCSTRSVLIDDSGKVIDVELQQELQAERNLFD